MSKGTPINIYLPRDQVKMLDSLAQAMAQGRTGIRPTRSQLIVKAIGNFINDCRSTKRLRLAIEIVERSIEAEKNPKGEPGLRLLSRASNSK